MRAALLCCAVLAVFIAGASPAQDHGDAVRLDDFALPAAAQPFPVEQLTKGDKLPAPEQHADRTLASPPPSEPGGAMPSQLSAAGEDSAMTQLAATGQSRTALTGSVADPRDRPPGAVTRIGGHDRCDPQAVQAVYAECLRILERRSDEFSAPKAPTLSAEQRLLAEQRQGDETMTPSSALRLRLASVAQPDADLASNQELASVYLREPENPVVVPAAEPEAKRLRGPAPGLGPAAALYWRLTPMLSPLVAQPLETSGSQPMNMMKSFAVATAER